MNDSVSKSVSSRQEEAFGFWEGSWSPWKGPALWLPPTHSLSRGGVCKSSGGPGKLFDLPFGTSPMSLGVLEPPGSSLPLGSCWELLLVTQSGGSLGQGPTPPAGSHPSDELAHRAGPPWRRPAFSFIMSPELCLTLCFVNSSTA